MMTPLLMMTLVLKMMKMTGVGDDDKISLNIIAMTLVRTLVLTMMTEACWP